MKTGFTPPMGINFRSADELTAVQLSTCLRRIVSFLETVDSNRDLIKYHDWWEHDGLHFEKSTLDFRALFEMVETGDSVFGATPDDDYVCVGVAPTDAEWYLRFRAIPCDRTHSLERQNTMRRNANEECEAAVVGRFDITLAEPLAERFRNEVIANLQCAIVEEPASTYYQRITV